MTNVCVSNTAGSPNKHGNFAYVRVNIPNALTYTITVTGSAGRDPDFIVLQNGYVGKADADSTATGIETSRFALAVGPAVILFNDFNMDANSPKCFTVNIAP
jgi:hypothetical protein